MNYYSLTHQTDVDNRTAVQALLPYFRGEKLPLILAVVCTLLSSAVEIFTPFLVTIAIDTYIKHGDLAGLGWLTFWTVLVYLGGAVVNYLQGYTMGTLAQRILFQIRANLFGHIQVMPLAFFNANKTGDIIARITNDTQKINEFLSRTIFQFFSSAVTFVGIGVFIFFLNVPLALTLWITLLIIIGLTAFLNPIVKKANKSALEANGEMSSVIEENLTNYQAIVAFDQQEFVRQTFEKSSRQTYKKTIVSTLIAQVFQPLYGFAGNAGQVAVLIVGLILVARGEATVGILVGFVTYAQRLSIPLADVGSSWGSVQSALAAWRRALQLLMIKPRS
jgi:ATP-binding cassette, subfamily B, bacterial